MKKVYGIGVNDVPGMSKHPLYGVWRNMLGRCYDSNIQKKHPTYLGCSVCTDWHLLSNFLEWAKSRWAPGYHLDKDILVAGNKVYAPDRCLFVIPAVNNLLTHCGQTNGQGLLGFHKTRYGRFEAGMTTQGQTVFLGLFMTPEEAYRCYVPAKVAEIRRVAALQGNPLVLQGLERHARRLEASIKGGRVPSVAALKDDLPFRRTSDGVVW